MQQSLEDVEKGHKEESKGSVALSCAQSERERGKGKKKKV